MLNKDFLLAGKAIFTVSNPSGVRYTYKVTKKDASLQFPETYFAKVLTGPCNTNDYTYMGILDTSNGEVRMTKASKYTPDTLPVKVLRWVAAVLLSGKQLPDGYNIHHEGKCGRCGRTLTVPESVESGFGPECIKRVA